MKAILISIKPKWVAKILNGEKTIEIRKTMPKCDLPIDVYIYCTKGKPLMYCSDKRWHWHIKEIKNFQYDMRFNYYAGFNSKVVAKFTLNKVEEIGMWNYSEYGTQTLFEKHLCIMSCLDACEIKDYLKGKSGYAWHIDNLEIFDEPKELSEFSPYECNEKRCEHCPYYYDDYGEKGCYMQNNENRCALTKAPQSWQFIEVEE